MSKSQWTGHDNNMWVPAGATTPHLNPGIYQMVVSMMGPCLCQYKPKHDKGVICEDGVSEHLFKGIEEFWRSKEKYQKMGMLHKRGILLEGPPGSGKTMSAMLLGARIAEHGAVAITFTNPRTRIGHLVQMLSGVRDVQPDLPLLVILEDLNAIVDEDSDNSVEEVLALLDGQNQIDNVVYLATTNYLKELDSRITNRPSRFDDVVHVGPPSRQARFSYLKQIVPADMADEGKLQELAKESEGLMMAHLRELVVSHIVLGKPVKDVVGRLKKMDAEALAAEQERKAAGKERPTKNRR